MHRKYELLTPTQISKVTKSTLSCHTKRSRTNSLFTLQIKQAKQPWEQIKQNKLKTIYNKRKNKLKQIEKQNLAIFQRINNQKPCYLPQNDLKYKNNLQKYYTLNHRRSKCFQTLINSYENKQNLTQIDRVLSARDKQIKRYAIGKNIL